jgi:iron(III) transport system substrate-binding protein
VGGHTVAANDPQIFEKNGAILEAINNGVVETGLLNHYYWFAQAAERGTENMRAQLSYPEAGDVGSIVNRYPCRSSGQRGHRRRYPLVGGIAAPVGVPALGSLVNAKLDLADLESLAETQDLLGKYGLI